MLATSFLDNKAVKALLELESWDKPTGMDSAGD